MVNSRIISRFKEGFPKPGQSRVIKGGPLYPAQEVIECLNTDTVIPWAGCRRDLQKWTLDTEDLVDLVRLAVSGGQFLKSEWCTQKPGGPWAACDAYSIIYQEWNDTVNKHYSIEYYVKFAINKTGRVILTISCHPSGS
ncbi:MAG: hypothetical protein MJK04_00410 [Psychrosphaera sp.]|nr:hypothetical protein [Psychrosphaera sp.]